MSLIREIVKRFTRSPKWHRTRDQFLKQHRQCSCCGSTKKVEVHHKQPFHQHPELELDPDNLISLCDGSCRCHLLIGHLGSWQSSNLGVEKDAEYLNMKIRNRPR